MADETNNALLDDERRLTSHQGVKASIDDDVNVRIRQESARVEPKESVELAGVVHDLKQQSVREAAETERELERSRTAARISQVVDYLFYITYGLIGLQFVLRLMGARPGNGFVQFVAGVSWPLLAPFERIVGTPSVGAFQIQLSHLLALFIYILLHIAINGTFRIIAYRRVTV
jgi:uncharacterized protein YggT (Ycf19 family)